MVERGATFSGNCSFRVGGEIALCVFPRSADELIFAVEEAERHGEKYVVLGNMTNILPPDGIYDGTVIVTSKMRSVTVEDRNFKADAGFPLTALSALTANVGLSGLEFAYGIPGSVGGAVYMNAGAYGGQMADVITSVVAYSPTENKVKTYSNEECRFGYRESIFRANGEIILSAEMSFAQGDGEKILSDCEKNMAARKEKQPLDKPSAGSTFRRPEGHYAGALIEAAGLKGFSVGGAQVSEKHAGFVVNRGGATFDDVLRLMDDVRSAVLRTSGVELEPEVKIIRG